MEQITSAAAQILIAIIPIVGIFMGSIVVFFYLLWTYRRRILLIKAGHYSRPQFDLITFSLLAGLLLSSVGLSLTVFLAVATGFTYGLLGGIIPLSIGTGLLVFHIIKRGKKA